MYPHDTVRDSGECMFVCLIVLKYNQRLTVILHPNNT